MTPDPNPSAGRRNPAPCPICGRPADPAQRPFCSSRCRQVDLGAWLNGSYAIPGDPLNGSPADAEEQDGEDRRI